MINFITYDLETGRILELNATSDPAILAIYQSLHSVLILDAPLADAPAHYVVDGAIRPRQEPSVEVSKTTIVADGADAAEITGLPAPGMLTINGQSVDVPDGSLTVRSRHPATFVVALDHWPYLPWSVTVEAQ